MAEQNPAPGFFQKRELLYSERPNVEALKALASVCLGEGLFEAALELSAKAGDAGGAERVLDAARQAGDTFAAEAALRALGRPAPGGLWEEVGETANLAEKEPEKAAELRASLRAWMNSDPAEIPGVNPHYDSEKALVETREKQPWN